MRFVAISLALFSLLRPALATPDTQLLNKRSVSYGVHRNRLPRVPWGTENVPSGVGSLSQKETNGNSLLGTIDAPRYGHYIGDTAPWGSVTTKSKRDASPPKTGVTRSYNFNVTRATVAPDGVQITGMLINGEFPGPTIEANWGDTISVTVTNSIVGPQDGMTIHWHGMTQQGTNWMDGIPGIQQCPIAPGETFTYTFIADPYGTAWYHSHYSAQAVGGVFGALIIHGPNDNSGYNIDLGPVFLNDWYHQNFTYTLNNVMGTNLSAFIPHSQNNLINGKGSVNCSLITDGTPCTPNAGYSKFVLTPGQTHRIRLINAAAEGLQKFSIDNHELTVMAVDLVPIVPYNTTIVTLGPGQRTDVIVYANQGSINNGTFWMRTNITSCSFTVQPVGLAMVYYEGENTNLKPNSTGWVDNTNPCANDALSTTVPASAMTPPNPTFSSSMTVNLVQNATGHMVWTINNSSFQVNYNDPVLQLANKGNDSYPLDPQWNVYDFKTNTSVRILFYNPTDGYHPMHLHGHNFYVLAEGLGTGPWNGTVVNPSNPTRRDTQIVQPEGYIILQMDMTNPGVWPFHCHIAWHVASGLFVTIFDNTPLIPKMTIPSSIGQTCTDWSAWTAKNVVDQIDSGV